MKRILVAGATGYLGGFVERGHLVRAQARSPGKLDPIRESLDEIVEAEVTRPETLNTVCDGMDAVFSSIGITRQRDGLTFMDVDYQANRNLLDAALKAGEAAVVVARALMDIRPKAQYLTGPGARKMKNPGYLPSGLRDHLMYRAIYTEHRR
jgi:uncharacterized protein YbjT (DUF2867 family)